MQRNTFDFRWLKRIGEQPRKNILHREGNGKTVGRKGIAGREGVFDFHGRMPLQSNFTRKLQRGAFPVDRVLC